jgi:hypothetical protein
VSGAYEADGIAYATLKDVPYGATVRLQAIPQMGFRFIGWYIQGPSGAYWDYNSVITRSGSSTEGTIEADFMQN